MRHEDPAANRKWLQAGFHIKMDQDGREMIRSFNNKCQIMDRLAPEPPIGGGGGLLFWLSLVPSIRHPDPLLNTVVRRSRRSSE